MQINLKEELNGPQFEAASTINGPVLILAGAGSGKTRTLTFRMAHMIDNLGISPTEILGITFTNKAANEMAQRVNKLLGPKKTKGITLSTFHSLCVSILKAEITRLGYQKNFSIYDSSDQMGLIRDILKYYRSAKAFDRKVILSKIGQLKNNGIGPDHFRNSKYFDYDCPYDEVIDYVYTKYQDRLKFYNAIDFDDLLRLVVDIFTQWPEVADKYSLKYKYIMVDEYQDTNQLQFELIKNLTRKHHNLCVVGDDDQSIYGFRGADISNILGFEKIYPETTFIKLEQNYRSNAAIINLSNLVIKENKNRKDKTLWTAIESTHKPLLWATADTEHEAAIIADDITQYQESGGLLSQVAILCRSNTQMPAFEDALRMAQIPYTLVGGQKFYDKKEVKDITAYLNVVKNINDALALRRILNTPSRSIGNVTLDRFLSISEEKSVSLFRAMEQFSILDPKKQGVLENFCGLIRKIQDEFNKSTLPVALEKLITELDFYQYIEKTNTNPKQAARRKLDLDQFIRSAEMFENYCQGKATLSDFLEKIVLQDNQNQQKEQEQKNEITLMTLHASKGLEFDKVYLVGMEEDILPHKKVIDSAENVDEERRLCYVGITRAKNHLVMSYAKERKLYGKKIKRFPSRFINNLDSNTYITQDRTTFGHLSESEAKEYKKSFFEDLISQI